MDELASHAAATTQSRTTCAGRQGFMLLDVVMTLAILTVGILAILFVFQASFRASRDVGAADAASAALENAVETLETADFKTLYAAFQGVRLPVPDLVAPSGGPASVLVQFEVNELALASEYGPVEDIDGDGALSNVNAAANYVLLPTRLTLSYVMSHGPEVEEMYLLLRSR